MNGYFKWGLIFALLAAGFLSLYLRASLLTTILRFLRRTSADMAEKDRRLLLENRRALQEIERKNTLWQRIGRTLEYSGLRRRFPRLTPTRFLAGNLVLTGICIAGGSALFGFLPGLIAATGLLAIEEFALILARAGAQRRVDENLLKFLDFLGNYNLTGGELAGILGQISRYLDEPLHSALEECEAESRLTGDVGTAVLAMGERIEHPQFKSFVRNLEMTTRYSTDFAPLVADSRRSMRNYLSRARERKGMLREALINMVLLLLMSAVVLIVVAGLIETPLSVMLSDPVGKIGLAVVGGILLIFTAQALSVNG
ncbi:MAG: hypothetical protein K5891_10650 [Lachnospiraceae bacterium]|nr:hypothetical protein [Lachnospiraceae bacterium]